MAGQRRLDGDLRGLTVTDLADHDDVGVGAHHRAQAGGEREADLGGHLHLREACHFILDWVLHGDDVLLGRVEQLQRGIERRGLARPGRAGHEHRAVRLVAGRFEAFALGAPVNVLGLMGDRRKYV